METPEACTARVNEPDNSAAAVGTLDSLSLAHSFPAAAAAAATKDLQTKSACSQSVRRRFLGAVRLCLGLSSGA